LDRTNVAQFSAGVEAIGQQLVVMGVRSKTKLDPASNIVRVLIDMFVEIGDSIALQYGGSEAHKKVTATNAESNIPGPIGKVWQPNWITCTFKLTTSLKPHLCCSTKNCLHRFDATTATLLRIA